MFSWTRASTASWPQTSLNRVFTSSGKYTSMPWRPAYQASPTNWMMMTKNRIANWKTNGRAWTSRTGNSNSAVAGATLNADANTRSRTTRKTPHLIVRAMRKRVQSLTPLKRRSTPPKTRSFQKRW